MRIKNCIEFENVSFSYGEHIILDNINFVVECGDYIGVIGPNGGGKTTLIKLILGLLKQNNGKIKILGQDIKKFKQKSLIGYVPQRVSQDISYFGATVQEIVESGRTPRLGVFGKFGKKDLLAVNKAMKIVEIENKKNVLISELSGGERQRVFIARALASEPQILILDEPSVGVDILAQEKFYSVLEKLNLSELTILFVSHDMDIVASEVKRLLCVNKNLLCQTSPKEFLKKEENLEKLYGRKIKFTHHMH